jgi:hypothetical protein
MLSLLLPTFFPVVFFFFFFFFFFSVVLLSIRVGLLFGVSLLDPMSEVFTSRNRVQGLYLNASAYAAMDSARRQLFGLNITTGTY